MFIFGFQPTAGIRSQNQGALIDLIWVGARDHIPLPLNRIVISCAFPKLASNFSLIRLSIVLSWADFPLQLISCFFIKFLAKENIGRFFFNQTYAWIVASRAGNVFISLQKLVLFKSSSNSLGHLSFLGKGINLISPWTGNVLLEFLDSFVLRKFAAVFGQSIRNVVYSRACHYLSVEFIQIFVFFWFRETASFSILKVLLEERFLFINRSRGFWLKSLIETTWYFSAFLLC